MVHSNVIFLFVKRTIFKIYITVKFNSIFVFAILRLKILFLDILIGFKVQIKEAL